MNSNALSAAANPLGNLADRLSSAVIVRVLSEIPLPAQKWRLWGAANLLSAAAPGLPAVATGLALTHLLSSPVDLPCGSVGLRRFRKDWRGSSHGSRCSSVDLSRSLVDVRHSTSHVRRSLFHLRGWRRGLRKSSED